MFWPFTVWGNCSSDLKNFANSRPSAWNFKSFSRSLEQFFLTVGQNNFGNKIPKLVLSIYFNKKGTLAILLLLTFLKAKQKLITPEIDDEKRKRKEYQKTEIAKNMARRDRDDDSIREPKYGTEDKYSKWLKTFLHLNFSWFKVKV